MMISLRSGLRVLVLLLIFTQWLTSTEATEDIAEAGEHFLEAREETLQNKYSQQDVGTEDQIAVLTARLDKIDEKLIEILDCCPAKKNAGKSCKDILAANEFASSGIYWIKPAYNKPVFQVYCDMATHEGGWTLVYSYNFTDYNSFSSASNAIIPRPNWPASDADVPIATNPPITESSQGAVDWNLWKNIGEEIMIKSNINDWIVCQPSGGSLVSVRQGGMSCQNIKNVATACSGVVPDAISWHTYKTNAAGFWSYGPSFKIGSSDYYNFNAGRKYGWPTHDPCGNGGTNQKKGVSHPKGQIYLR